ncbi:MAG: hypothetical protein QOE75_2255 [Solirubrobacterales bacterium]|nr:hypothetical protein [Solirubrobacterales bacterium]
MVALHEALRTAGLPHAFGGALALAYYAEPRPTADIDLNVFVPPAEWPRVRAALTPLGAGAERDAPGEDGELRLRCCHQEVHLFFSTDPLHAAMEASARELPCNGTVVPVVAPEHLIVRKAVLDREKDWVDIAAIVANTERLDRGEAERWLELLVGRSDPRLTKLYELTKS